MQFQLSKSTMAKMAACQNMTVYWLTLIDHHLDGVEIEALNSKIICWYKVNLEVLLLDWGSTVRF